jgi:hypothetical protein
MAEVKFSKTPIIVGATAAASGIEVGPGFVRMNVTDKGEKLELVMPADEAERMGCGFIVAAHAARQLKATPTMSGLDSFNRGH